MQLSLDNLGLLLREDEETTVRENEEAHPALQETAPAGPAHNPTINSSSIKALLCRACSQIESDLRALALEQSRRHPELRALIETGLLRIVDFIDILDSKKTSGGGFRFPTASLLAISGSIVQLLYHDEASAGTISMRTILAAVTIVQKLLALWRQTEDFKFHVQSLCPSDVSITDCCLQPSGNCDASPSPSCSNQGGALSCEACSIEVVSPTIKDSSHSSQFQESKSYDPLFDENEVVKKILAIPIISGEEFQVILRLLAGFSCMAPEIHYMLQTNCSVDSRRAGILDSAESINFFLNGKSDAPALLARANASAARAIPRKSSELEQIQLRAMQALFLLFTTDTPITASSNIDIHGAVTTAVARCRLIIALLCTLRDPKNATAVSIAANAGLAQFLRCLLDSAGAVVMEVESAKLQAIPAERLTPIAAAYCVMTALCDILCSARLTEDVTKNDSPMPSSHAPEEINVGAVIAAVPILDLSYLPERLAEDLLLSALGLPHFIFRKVQAFQVLLQQRFQKAVLEKLTLVSDTNLSPANMLRVMRLVQCLWTLMEQVPCACPESLLSALMAQIERLFIQPTSGHKKIIALLFLRWLLERSDHVRCLLSRTHKAIQRSCVDSVVCDDELPHRVHEATYLRGDCTCEKEKDMGLKKIAIFLNSLIYQVTIVDTLASETGKGELSCFPLESEYRHSRLNPVLTTALFRSPNTDLRPEATDATGPNVKRLFWSDLFPAVQSPAATNNLESLLVEETLLESSTNSRTGKTGESPAGQSRILSLAIEITMLFCANLFELALTGAEPVSTMTESTSPGGEPGSATLANFEIFATVCPTGDILLKSVPQPFTRPQSRLASILSGCWPPLASAFSLLLKFDFPAIPLLLSSYRALTAACLMLRIEQAGLSCLQSLSKFATVPFHRSLTVGESIGPASLESPLPPPQEPAERMTPPVAMSPSRSWWPLGRENRYGSRIIQKDTVANNRSHNVTESAGICLLKPNHLIAMKLLLGMARSFFNILGVEEWQTLLVALGNIRHHLTDQNVKVAGSIPTGAAAKHRGSHGDYLSVATTTFVSSLDFALNDHLQHIDTPIETTMFGNQDNQLSKKRVGLAGQPFSAIDATTGLEDKSQLFLLRGSLCGVFADIDRIELSPLATSTFILGLVSLTRHCNLSPCISIGTPDYSTTSISFQAPSGHQSRHQSGDQSLGQSLRPSESSGKCSSNKDTTDNSSCETQMSLKLMFTEMSRGLPGAVPPISHAVEPYITDFALSQIHILISCSNEAIWRPVPLAFLCKNLELIIVPDRRALRQQAGPTTHKSLHDESYLHSRTDIQETSSSQNSALHAPLDASFQAAAGTDSTMGSSKPADNNEVSATSTPPEIPRQSRDTPDNVAAKPTLPAAAQATEAMKVLGRLALRVIVLKPGHDTILLPLVTIAALIYDSGVPPACRYLAMDAVLNCLRVCAGATLHKDGWTVFIVILSYAKRLFQDHGNQAQIEPLCAHLLAIGSILVQDFHSEILQSPGLPLVVSTLEALARSTVLGDNASFSAVGLLWTVAEALACLPSTTDSCSTMRDLVRNSSTEKIESTGQEMNTDSSTRTGIHLENDELTTENLATFEQSGPLPSADVMGIRLALKLPTNDLAAKETRSREIISNNCSSERLKSLMQIFKVFSSLAMDPRVEVRNCSLKSLTSVYRTVHAANCAFPMVPGTVDANALKGVVSDDGNLFHEVLLGATLIDALTAVGGCFCRLLQSMPEAQIPAENVEGVNIAVEAEQPVNPDYNGGTVPNSVQSTTELSAATPVPSTLELLSLPSSGGLQHHSRDSALKMWDETLTIICDGVIAMLENFIATVKGVAQQRRGTQRDLSMHNCYQSTWNVLLQHAIGFLEKALTPLCDLLRIILRQPTRPSQVVGNGKTPVLLEFTTAVPLSPHVTITAFMLLKTLLHLTRTLIEITGTEAEVSRTEIIAEIDRKISKDISRNPDMKELKLLQNSIELTLWGLLEDACTGLWATSGPSDRAAAAALGCFIEAIELLRSKTNVKRDNFSTQFRLVLKLLCVIASSSLYEAPFKQMLMSADQTSLETIEGGSLPRGPSNVRTALSDSSLLEPRAPDVSNQVGHINREDQVEVLRVALLKSSELNGGENRPFFVERVGLFAAFLESPVLISTPVPSADPVGYASHERNSDPAMQFTAKPVPGFTDIKQWIGRYPSGATQKELSKTRLNMTPLFHCEETTLAVPLGLLRDLQEICGFSRQGALENAKNYDPEGSNGFDGPQGTKLAHCVITGSLTQCSCSAFGTPLFLPLSFLWAGVRDRNASPTLTIELERFDDDYGSRPPPIAEGGLADMALEMSCAQKVGPDKQACLWASIERSANRICRSVKSSRKPSPLEADILLSIEKLPWANLLKENTLEWLNLFVTLLDLFLQPVRALGHVAAILFAAQLINSLARLLRLIARYTQFPALCELIVLQSILIFYHSTAENEDMLKVCATAYGFAAFAFFNALHNLTKSTVSAITGFRAFIVEATHQLIFDLHQVCLAPQGKANIIPVCWAVLGAIATTLLTSPMEMAIRAPWKEERQLLSANPQRVPPWVCSPDSIWAGAATQDFLILVHRMLCGTTEAPPPPSAYCHMIEALEKVRSTAVLNGANSTAQRALLILFDALDTLYETRADSHEEEDILSCRRTAATALVLQIRNVFSSFIQDDSRSGQMRSVRVRGSAVDHLADLSQIKLLGALHEDQALIAVLLRDLHELINAKDESVRRELAHIMRFVFKPDPPS